MKSVEWSPETTMRLSRNGIPGRTEKSRQGDTAEETERAGTRYERGKGLEVWTTPRLCTDAPGLFLESRLPNMLYVDIEKDRGRGSNIGDQQTSAWWLWHRTFGSKIDTETVNRSVVMPSGRSKEMKLVVALVGLKGRHAIDIIDIQSDLA